MRDGLPHGEPADRRPRLRSDRRASARSPRCFSSNKYVRDAALGNSEPLLGGDRAVGVRAPPRRPPRPRALPRRRSRRCCGPRPGPSSACTGSGCGSTDPQLRARLVAFAVLIPVALVPARVVGLRRPAARRLARERAQPRQRRVRRHPGVRAWLKRFAQVTIAPVELGTLVAVGFAGVMWRRYRTRGGSRSRSRSCGLAWFVLVAAMTEAGFAGNQRYLIVTTAVVCVLGGDRRGARAPGGRVGGDAGGSARAARRRSRSAALLLGVAVGLADDHRQGRQRRHACAAGSSTRRILWHDLKGLVDEAGGKSRLLACGGVFSGPFQTQMVAYELGVHGIQVGWKVTPPPGVDLPHAHRARRAARDQADRRSLPARRDQRQVAAADRAARGPHRLPEGEPVRAHLRRTAGNVATKDAPLEVIGDPQRTAIGDD